MMGTRHTSSALQSSVLCPNTALFGQGGMLVDPSAQASTCTHTFADLAEVSLLDSLTRPRCTPPFSLRRCVGAILCVVRVKGSAMVAVCSALNA